MNCKLLRIKAVDHRFTTVPTRQILYPLATTTMQKGEQDGEEGEEGGEGLRWGAGTGEAAGPSKPREALSDAN